MASDVDLLKSIQEGRSGSATPRIETQIDMAEFNRLYFEEYLSISAIAKHFNRGDDAFRAMIKRLNLVRVKPYQNESLLRKLYCEDNLCIRDIAKKLKCDEVTVKSWVDKFGLVKTEEQVKLLSQQRTERIIATVNNQYNDSNNSSVEKTSINTKAREAMAARTRMWRANNPEAAKAAVEKSKQAVRDKYGVDCIFEHPEFKAHAAQVRESRSAEERQVIIDKVKATTIKNHGGVGFASPLLKRKALDTYYQKRFGRDYIPEVDSDLTFSDPHVLEHCKDIMEAKHGVRYGFCSSEISEKARNGAEATFRAKYGFDSWITSKYPVEVANIVTNKDNFEKVLVDIPTDLRSPSYCSKQIGVDLSEFAYWYHKHECQVPLVKLVSSIQATIRTFLDEVGVKYVENDRSIIAPKELDFYIPNHNLAIEVNGIGSHNVSRPMFGTHSVDKYYHQQKVLDCRSKGIHLIHIYEHEISNLLQLSKIQAYLGDLLSDTAVIYARKCKVVELSSPDCSQFIEKFHLQGNAPASIRLGLIYENELVQVMTFGRPRFTDNYEWELIRLVAKSGMHIVGGASKLFNYFLNKYQPETVVSYCNIDKFKGTVYTQMNFSYHSTSVPGYWWIESRKAQRVLSRYQCQKHKLKQVLGDKFDPNASEAHNMEHNGFVRVYDSGNDVYIWRKNICQE